VKAGSLFPALHRLEQDGFIRGDWSNTPDGYRAKYYTLTSRGQRHTRELFDHVFVREALRFCAWQDHLAPFVTELKTGDRMVVQDKRGNVVKDTVNEQRQRLANKPRDASAIARRLR